MKLVEPPYDDLSQQPKTLTKSARKHDKTVLYVAGKGPEQADIMIVTAAVQEEEAQESSISGYGMTIQDKAEYMKGPIGMMFKDIALAAGVDFEKCYYTSVCKWLLPRTARNRPPAKTIRWGEPILMDEIKRVKPKIIVCAGKQAFDLLMGEKISFKDANGCWFWSSKAKAHLYLMKSPHLLLGNPELYEVFRLDMREVMLQHKRIRGQDTEEYPIEQKVLRCEADIVEWVAKMTEEKWKLFSVDCEWHGETYLNGDLRTIQFCWTPGKAVAIRFMDDQLEYALDITYEAVGKLLQPLLDPDDVKYVGHHWPADAVWMHHWLGLKVLEKCYMDTEFAQQTVDEHSELGLERGIAMRYSTLGRYDMALTMWKRANKTLCERGYGLIPDDILLPYACLRKDSLIMLADGSKRNIRDLVNSKYTGEVKAVLGGKVVNRKVTNWYKHNAKQKVWYKLDTLGSKRSKHGTLVGPAFTPDHELVTTRGKVAVEDVILGRDRIVTDENRFNPDQMSILLGSLLGDGGLMQRNNAGATFTFSQSSPRENYAKWKATMLSSVLDLKSTHIAASGNTSSRVTYKSKGHRYLAEVLETHPRKTSDETYSRKLVITPDLLQKLGPIGLAVWYQDDGTFTRDNTCRLTCMKLRTEEIAVMEDYFAVYGDATYSMGQEAIMFSRRASKAFLQDIAGWMHPACAYKSDITVGGKLSRIDTVADGLYAVPIRNIELAPNHKNYGHTIRYCLSVEEAENFLTTEGFVSNCHDVNSLMKANP